MIRSFNSVVTDSLCPFPFPTHISNLLISQSFHHYRTSRFSHWCLRAFSSPIKLPFVTANTPFTFTLTHSNFTSCSINMLRMKPQGNRGFFWPSLFLITLLFTLLLTKQEAITDWNTHILTKAGTIPATYRNYHCSFEIQNTTSWAQSQLTTDLINSIE